MSELGEIISARFTTAEKVVLKRAADREGISLSTFVRNALLVDELRSRPGVHFRTLPGGGQLTWWDNAPGLVQAG